MKRDELLLYALLAVALTGVVVGSLRVLGILPPVERKGPWERPPYSWFVDDEDR